MTTGRRVRGIKRQAGFTFIELIIVITLLGLLSAAALSRFLDVTDEAEIASLEGVAGGFTTAVSIAHAQWFAEGHTKGAATTGSDKISINLDGKIIYMNENGWPANTATSSDASEDTQTAEECQEVWNALFQSAPASTTSSSRRVKGDYFISVIDSNPDICRYELILNTASSASATHYFDYELDDGTVTVVKPREF